MPAVAPPSIWSDEPGEVAVHVDEADEDELPLGRATLKRRSQEIVEQGAI